MMPDDPAKEERQLTNGKGGSLAEQFTKELEEAMDVKEVIATHKKLLKAKSEGVRLQAVKLAYEVGGVGHSPKNPLPLIILSKSVNLSLSHENETGASVEKNDTIPGEVMEG